MNALWKLCAVLLVNLHLSFTACGTPPLSNEGRMLLEGVQRALEQRDQQGVSDIAKAMEHNRSEVLAMAMVALVRLSDSDLDLDAPLTLAKKYYLEPKYLSTHLAAGAWILEILRNESLSREEKEEAIIPLTRHEQAAMRRLAVEGLKKVGGPACLSVLEERSGDRNETDEWDPVNSMLPISGIAFEAWWTIKKAGLTDQEALDALIAWMMLGKNFVAGWSAAAKEALQALDVDPTRKLVKLYVNGPPPAKWWAWVCLRERELDMQSAKLLREAALRDIDHELETVRKVAEALLWPVEDLRLIETWLLRHQADDVREAAANNLIVMKTSVPLDLYVAGLKDHSPTVRRVLVHGLARIEGEAAQEQLRACLLDTDEQVRVSAASALLRRGLDDGHPILIEAMASTDYVARHLALSAIPQLDRTKVDERIMGILGGISDSSVGVKDGARSADAVSMYTDVVGTLFKRPREQVEHFFPLLISLLEDPVVGRSAGMLLRNHGFELDWYYSHEEGRGWYVLKSPSAGSTQP